MGARAQAAVQATSAALAVIRRLEAAHGPLSFFQSGGCCDGTSPMCLKDGEHRAMSGYAVGRHPWS
jgi:uncharacterized protein